MLSTKSTKDFLSTSFQNYVGGHAHRMAEQKPGYCWNCDHEVTVHVDEAAGDVHCTSCEGSCVEVREPEQVIHHGVMCDRSGTCISLGIQ